MPSTVSRLCRLPQRDALSGGRPELGCASGLARVRNYMAFGTPVESFSSCLRVKPAKGREESRPRPITATLSATVRFTAKRATVQVDPLCLFWVEESEDDAQKSGNSGGHLLMIFPAAGDVLLLLILVIGLYRKSCYSRCSTSTHKLSYLQTQ